MEFLVIAVLAFVALLIIRGPRQKMKQEYFGNSNKAPDWEDALAGRAYAGDRLGTKEAARHISDKRLKKA